ncbi:MAG: flagellar biosynthesis anti-sigma factor FlgM [Vallitalea sp.]|jgi:negative regulator of flagellin synthesis FlgM|nr:flagellar biosynthesis anti-sigma factor FlgM [Vallitalea sp.]
MRINGIKSVNSAYKVNRTDKINKVSKIKKEKDSLAISDIAKELQIAKKAVNNTADTREKKVKEIKSRIESGTYNVSGKEVADKIVDRYFDERR